MDEELIKKADTTYRMAEKKAADYFKSLSVQLKNKTFTEITKDIQSWKQNHIQHHSLLSLFYRKKGKPDDQEYHDYIQWLDYTGKLDDYLDRSISYIFMRDLGKSLNSPDTEDRIKRVVINLKKQLTHSATTDGGKTEMYSMAWLYRMAQEEDVESTMIWLIGKLKTVSSYIPKGMDADEAKRKLIKIIAGVVIHQVEEMGDEISAEERTQKLDEAIRLGYSYGLTYPFIDDILDSEVLSDSEKKQYSELIRTTLITGTVPELEGWTGNNKDLIRYIHSELSNAYNYIKAHLRTKTTDSFFEQSYVFFHSQEVDRIKDLSNANYTNEDLYIPIILKSASSRLIVRSVISASEDEDIDSNTFFYGIYNQLADDFADMFDDLEAGAVTPYTYYIKYHDKRKDLINPFELYWTVIFNLIHNVYHSDTKVSEVILDRAINGLKRFKERMGDKRYNEVMGLFAPGNLKFNKLIQNMVRKANNVDFFDKLLRDHMITNFNNERKEREDFLDTIEMVRNQINNILHIPKVNLQSFMKEPITDAANYSLEGDGKRIRAIMTWLMGVNEYGLDKEAIIPLLKSLEYMHTASLIFDDLPSQDNAPIRRGRPTLHQVYNTAIAELTGLYLTQKAVEEQASLVQFDANTVLHLIQYSARMTADMCKGQAMDLDSKGKQLTLEQLNTISFYKTGIAFEASLVMPAILAGKQELEMTALKKFAYHAGIAFQIKDDLLDAEGDEALLGKPTGKDVENNNSTFVSILGAEGARKAMWEHYCLAMEVLKEVQHHTNYLKHLLNYIVNRDN
ncbi:polyprenyl synthetase family protein [Lederbergia wuyishanensis]|uniref:Geranylgeranyl pyrophosphate synthase n=1 Tax=Lederbergia wuyishanensis TaxID=1347903 RepID=A0ABU0D2G5_9BACI|nr:polyprenyl synthetase family protein [Lederbergia wuyishanensis]MCJ8007261.1 polyprenyl synthetase family protein [Lederbergia wuyishanensis]MDQ0342586.1 geranylgeranyl pyrophosphate synthase [Lederbergia wuyishanensis]